jgi:hypothetical protein
MSQNISNTELSKEAKSLMTYAGDGMSAIYQYFSKQRALRRLASNHLSNQVKLTGGLEEALKPKNRRFYVDQLTARKYGDFTDYNNLSNKASEYRRSLLNRNNLKKALIDQAHDPLRVSDINGDSHPLRSLLYQDLYALTKQPDKKQLKALVRYNNSNITPNITTYNRLVNTYGDLPLIHRGYTTDRTDEHPVLSAMAHMTDKLPGNWDSTRRWYSLLPEVSLGYGNRINIGSVSKDMQPVITKLKTPHVGGVYSTKELLKAKTKPVKSAGVSMIGASPDYEVALPFKYRKRLIKSGDFKNYIPDKSKIDIGALLNTYRTSTDPLPESIKTMTLMEATPEWENFISKFNLDPNTPYKGLKKFRTK